VESLDGVCKKQDRNIELEFAKKKEVDQLEISSAHFFTEKV
jgi:hypothetical protein